MVILVIGKTTISFTPLSILGSIGLHVSSDQFIALLLFGYCCIFSKTFFFADSCPSPALEEEEAIHIHTFNSLSEKQLDFRVLVTTAKLWKYGFYPNSAALPQNSQRLNTTSISRSRASTSGTLHTPGKSLSCNFFFLVRL